MQPTIRIHIVAITAGLFVGIVLQEISLSIFDLLRPDIDLSLAITGLQAQSGWFIPLMLGWWIGGFSAGIMSSMISRNLTSGCISGALLMLPALVLAQYGFDSAQQAALFTINPLIAAALGSWLAGRILIASKSTEDSSG